MVGFCCLLIVKEPDLGSTMVMAFAVVSLLTAAGVRMRTLAPVGAAIAIAALLMISISPYQQDRLTGFLHPTADASGAGFQANQAKIAVGSGGVFGVGLGESVQKASYLPEAHTDMIAAVIGEETGLVGIATLIGLFGLFGWAGMRAAHRARDRYSKLMAAGLTSLILAQAAVNLFAVLGLAPLTGVTLPFISYGGSSLIVTLASAGLILNVARRPGRFGLGAPRSRRPGRRRGAGAAARCETARCRRCRRKVNSEGGQRAPSVVIAAGGTAGHVVPALAVADALRAEGARVSFIGARDRAEAELVPAAGYEIDFLKVRGLDRRNPSRPPGRRCAPRAPSAPRARSSAAATPTR